MTGKSSLFLTSLLILSSLLPGCGFFVPKNSTLDFSEDNVQIAFVSLDEDAETLGFVFPETPVSSTSTQTITLQNYGALEATSLTVTEDPTVGKFNFDGGTYPGTGGTCTDTLAPDATCTVVIAFEADTTAGETYTADFTLSYFNGLETTTETLTLSATPPP